MSFNHENNNNDNSAVGQVPKAPEERPGEAGASTMTTRSSSSTARSTARLPLSPVVSRGGGDATKRNPQLKQSTTTAFVKGNLKKDDSDEDTEDEEPSDEGTDEDDDEDVYSDDNAGDYPTEDDQLTEQEAELQAFGCNTTNFTKDKQYIMPPRANSAAKKLVQNHCLQAASIVRKRNFEEDPHGCFAMDLVHLQPTRTCGTYTIRKAEDVPDVDLEIEGSPELEKHGSTSNLWQRRDFYREQGVSDERFKVITNYDMVDSETEQDLQEVYDQMMKDMQTNNSIPKGLQAICRVLREDHGECFGPKKRFFIQLIEGGLQLERGLSPDLEGIMYDVKVLNDSNELTDQEAAGILEELAPLLKSGATEIYYRAVMSWATGFFKTLSSLIVTTEALVGKGKSKNTLPIPVFPDATRLPRCQECEGGIQHRFQRRSPGRGDCTGRC